MKLKNSYICDLYFGTRDINFFEGYKSFCFQNCLRILLRSERIKCPELYVNAALGISCQIEFDKISINVGKNMRGLLPSFEGSYQRIYNPNNKSVNVLYDNFKYLEKKKKPMIIGVDTYYLPYASNYKKNHAIHTALLVGYDLDKRNVYIIDWYDPWFFWGEVTFEQCIAARSSTNPYDGTVFSGRPIENNYTVFENITEVDTDKLVFEMLKCSYDKCSAPNKEGKSFGVNAYLMLKEYIANNYDKFDATNLCYQIFEIINRYKFFEQYLKIAMKVLRISINDIDVECNKIIDELEIIRFILAKIGLVRDIKYIEKINIHMEKVIMLQKMIQKKIDNLLAKFSP